MAGVQVAAGARKRAGVGAGRVREPTLQFLEPCAISVCLQISGLVNVTAAPLLLRKMREKAVLEKSCVSHRENGSYCYCYSSRQVASTVMQTAVSA
jgi:hypothetical protein